MLIYVRNFPGPAEKIAEGIGLADHDMEVKVFNLTKSDENDLTTEVFKSKTVLIGSLALALRSLTMA